MSSFGSDRKPALSGQEVLPASQYLQERLQERRARNLRPRRARHTDFGPRSARDDDIFINEAEESRTSKAYDSSPLAFNGRSSLGAGGSASRRRALGIRDMDRHIDHLNKENFALKLELDHRRDHTAKLQEQVEDMKEQVERARKLEDEHTELLRINSQLVDELEKRDKAVEEAMDIICDLEDKVAELADRVSETRPSTANADSGYAGTEMHEQVPPSSPPEAARIPKTPAINLRRPSLPASAASHKLQGILDGQTPPRPRREPMALSHQKPTTQALRSVYLENSKQLHPVKSFQSLLSRRESMMDDEAVVEDVPNSPRLSVLSESSFPSIYNSNKKKLSPEQLDPRRYGDNALSPLDARVTFRQDSIKRVSEWISDRDAVHTTPSKSNNISAPLVSTADRAMPPPPPPHMSTQEHYRSLNTALNAVSSGPSELMHSVSSYGHFDKPLKKPGKPRPTSFAGPIFGEPLLPPTPDSASTRMLRASRSSMADEKSLLDTTPAVVRGYDVLQPKIRTAPRQMRSSVELNTALSNNLHFRHAGLGNARNDSSSDEEDDFDARSGTVRDFGMEYNDYPDGQSILYGTPSRFVKSGKMPAESILFDGHDISSPEATRSPPAQPVQALPHRRRSSAEMNLTANRPRLTRNDTSPTIFETLGRAFGAGPKTSVESVTSPKSSLSGSSGNRTIMQPDDHLFPAMSPELPRSVSRLSSAAVTSPSRARASPSPARTLGQKTHMLFRRLSNNNAERPEKPILPAFATTPTSAFGISTSATNTPTEARRPLTSNGDTPQGSPMTYQQPFGGREGRRPSVPNYIKPNVMTGGSSTPSLAAAVAEDYTHGSEKKSLFRRTQSVRTAQESESPLGAGKAPTGRRRNSIKDAVSTARRPWRGT